MCARCSGLVRDIGSKASLKTNGALITRIKSTRIFGDFYSCVENAATGLDYAVNKSARCYYVLEPLCHTVEDSLIEHTCLGEPTCSQASRNS